MTPFLEHLILQGLANYDTWTFGTSSTSTLRVPKNMFIILTDFDYFHFIDTPADDPGTPAESTTFFTLKVVDPLPFDAFFVLDGNPLVGVTFDPSNPAQAEIDLNAAITAVLPGWSATVVFFPNPINVWQVVITTSTPGTIYNGTTPLVTVSDPTIVDVNSFPFAGGADGATITNVDILNNSTHQMEFRTKGKTYSWIIRENLQFIARSRLPHGNVWGKYQKQGLYIPFTEDIQIDIAKVPYVDSWGILYQANDPKSNEPRNPAGFSNTNAPPAQNVVYEVLFDGPGGSEQYLPVTEDRNDQALSGNYREQFKVDYANGRELENPQNINGDTGAKRTYPVVNVGYIRINLNWKAFQEEYRKYIRLRDNNTSANDG